MQIWHRYVHYETPPPPTPPQIKEAAVTVGIFFSWQKLEVPIGGSFEGLCGNFYPHSIGQINHMTKLAPMVRGNKLCLWCEELPSHMGKSVDMEKGEELGIIKRTVYAKLLLSHIIIRNALWSWLYYCFNKQIMKWGLEKTRRLTQGNLVKWSR